MAGKGADGVDQLLAFNELFTKSAAAFVQVTQEREEKRREEMNGVRKRARARERQTASQRVRERERPNERERERDRTREIEGEIEGEKETERKRERWRCEGGDVVTDGGKEGRRGTRQFVQARWLMPAPNPVHAHCLILS
jgi:hypothetical protein